MPMHVRAPSPAPFGLIHLASAQRSCPEEDPSLGGDLPKGGDQEPVGGERTVRLAAARPQDDEYLDWLKGLSDEPPSGSRTARGRSEPPKRSDSDDFGD